MLALFSRAFQREQCLPQSCVAVGIGNFTQIGARTSLFVLYYAHFTLLLDKQRSSASPQQVLGIKSGQHLYVIKI